LGRRVKKPRRSTARPESNAIVNDVFPETRVSFGNEHIDQGNFFLFLKTKRPDFISTPQATSPIAHPASLSEPDATWGPGDHPLAAGGRLFVFYNPSPMAYPLLF